MAGLQSKTCSYNQQAASTFLGMGYQNLNNHYLSGESHAVNFFCVCCPVHRRTLGSYSESFHRSSSPITKQNTQNWFPWQRGEPNLEQLELNAARPVNTHGHTNTYLHEHNGSSFAPISRCLKCQKDCIFRHLLLYRKLKKNKHPHGRKGL